MKQNRGIQEGKVSRTCCEKVQAVNHMRRAIFTERCLQCGFQVETSNLSCFYNFAFYVEMSNVFLQPKMYRIKVCVYQYILYHSNHQFQLKSSWNLANLKDGEIRSIDGYSHLSINMHCKSAFLGPKTFSPASDNIGSSMKSLKMNPNSQDAFQSTDDTSPKVCNADHYSICMIIGMRYHRKSMCIEPNQKNWPGADKWDCFPALKGSYRSMCGNHCVCCVEKKHPEF